MFRRTMCAFLALFLIAGQLPLYARAEGDGAEETARIEETEVPEEALPEARVTVVASGKCGDSLTWTLMQNGTLNISGVGAIPDFGVNQSSWYSPWYSHNDDIRSIVVKNGVTRIGTEAFIYCRNAVSATIADSVTSIGEDAFAYCRALTEVTIPEGVTAIDRLSFFACSSMTSVTIPKSVTSIGSFAFCDCKALKDVYYGGNLESWKKISIADFNEPLERAVLHCQVEVSFVKGPNGEMLYYEDGKPVPNKYGFVDYNGSKFLVANGKIAADKSGLARDPEHPEDWYFLSHGQVQTQYTGLTQYDGEWFYVKNGKLDTTLSAVVEYNGGLFLVARGRLVQDKNGLGQDPVTHIWYYFSHGQVQTQFTGLVQYDGKWFYVRNGVFDSSFNGEIEYKGRRYLIKNGIMVQEIK